MRQNLRRRSEALDEHLGRGDEADDATGSAPRHPSPSFGRRRPGERLPPLQGRSRQRNGGVRGRHCDVTASRDVVGGRSDRADGDNAARDARAVSGAVRGLRARRREDNGRHEEVHDDDEGQNARHRQGEVSH